MKPPGHTCPQIDKAQSLLRRIRWWQQHRPDEQTQIRHLFVEAALALETVREENRQMRAAYWSMHKRLTAAGLPVTETPVAPVRDEEERASASSCSRCGHALRVHTTVRAGSGDPDATEYTDCLECGADQGICMPYTKYTLST
jgi:DNA-directed RNA polymerase subunit M/transcription elongation factor TFIIS